MANSKLRLMDTEYGGAPCQLVFLDLASDEVPPGVDPGMLVRYDDEPDAVVAVTADFDRFQPVTD